MRGGLMTSMSRPPLPEGVLLRTERSMIPPVGHPRRAKYEECIREAGKVLADAYDTGKVHFQEAA